MKNICPSQKLEVIAYADHHSVTAAGMNFSLSNSMVRRCKASKDALKQAPMKARKLRNGPKHHFQRGRVMVFDETWQERSHGHTVPCSQI
jgi:hypothetical protein